jgi:excisionase family DNA binding protein
MDEVTASQAAALTGLSERTIRRKIAAGEIPARHVASNRFAIKVADLPIRQSPDDLVARLEELEHRVRLLELQLRSSRLASRAAPPASTPTTMRGHGMDGAETPALAELLMQLAHETDRLMPVLMSLMGHDVHAADATVSMTPHISVEARHVPRQVRQRRRASAGAGSA